MTWFPDLKLYRLKKDLKKNFIKILTEIKMYAIVCACGIVLPLTWIYLPYKKVHAFWKEGLFLPPPPLPFFLNPRHMLGIFYYVLFAVDIILRLDIHFY